MKIGPLVLRSLFLVLFSHQSYRRVLSMSAPVTPHDFPEIRWRGHWIWVPEEPVEPSGFFSSGVNPHAKEAHGLFRKTIHLDRVPARAPARVTADSRYALFVNGQEIFRGPIR